MWREGFDNPVDYSDHGANCGTRSVSARLSSGTSKACTENAYIVHVHILLHQHSVHQCAHLGHHVIQVQHKQNGGRCGICGNNFADPTPRSYEAGGKYGNGIIVRTYTQGQVSTSSSGRTRRDR